MNTTSRWIAIGLICACFLFLAYQVWRDRRVREDQWDAIAALEAVVFGGVTDSDVRSLAELSLRRVQHLRRDTDEALALVFDHLENGAPRGRHAHTPKEAPQ